jgi:cbb3-type cytochrome oxidase subunit 1
LLPHTKVSGKVRSVGKLVERARAHKHTYTHTHTHTHTHVSIVKSCSLHYGVTDLMDRPDIYYCRILVDNSLLYTSKRL